MKSSSKWTGFFILGMFFELFYSMRIWTVIFVFLLSCQSKKKESTKSLQHTDKLSIRDEDIKKDSLEVKPKVTDPLVEEQPTSKQPSHKKEPQPTPEKLEEVEVMISEDTEVRKPAEMTSSFIRYDNHVRFKHKKSTFGDLSQSGTKTTVEWSFNIPLSRTDKEFQLQNDVLQKLNFEYKLSGGMYSEYSNQIEKGTISGKEMDENRWKVNIHIQFYQESMPEAENGKPFLNSIDQEITFSNP